MCDAQDPCSVNTAHEPKSSFTTSPRNTKRPLYFLELLFQFRILKVTKVHQRCKMNRISIVLCLLSNLLLAFYFGFSPCWLVLQFVQLFVNSGCCIWYLHRLRNRNGFVRKIVMSERITPSVSNVLFMTPVSVLLKAASWWFMSFDFLSVNCLTNLVVAWNCFPPMLIALLLLWRYLRRL